MISYVVFLSRIIAAEFIAGCIVYLSYAISLKMTNRQGIIIRWSTAIIVGLFLLTSIFHILLSLHQFKLIYCIIILGILAIIVRLSLFSFQTIFFQIFKDFIWIKRQAFCLYRSRYRLFYFFCILMMLITIVRTLQSPPLAWDTLVYHAVKPAMWIQNQGPISMIAPGAWLNQIAYHGGSEILTAWAMLPFHSDLFVSFNDAILWIFIGLASFGLCRELGVRYEFRWIAIFYILFIPALKRSIGTGYVESCLMLYLILGLMFTLRFIRKQEGISLILSAMAMSLAVGVKITMLPLFCMIGMIYVILFFRFKFGIKHLLKYYLPALILCVVIIGPWLMWSMHYTGFLMGHMPIQIFGMALGKPNPTLQWFQMRENWPLYQFPAELHALGQLFNSPLSSHSHLSFLSFLPFVLCLIVILKWIHKKPIYALTLFLWILSVLGYYYHPNFSVIRIGWASGNGRFLLPMILPAVLCGFVLLKNHSKWTSAFLVFSCIGTLLHGIATFYGDWMKIEIVAVICLMAGFTGLFMTIRLLRHRRYYKFIVLGLFILTFITISGLQYYHDHARYMLASGSAFNHDFHRYWTMSAKHVDEINHPHRIAVTSGPRQNNMTWFTYFFLGKRFQNTLHYISISKECKIIEFGPDHPREKQGCYACWLERLRLKKIDYVMSFIPTSIELNWMESHPEIFTKIESGEMGENSTWGFYKIIENRL